VPAAALWNAGDPPEAAGDRLMVERARKLQNYFTQPFFVAEPYTHRPGTLVSLDEALRTCRDILEGRHADISAKAFILPAASRDPRSSRRGSVGGGRRFFYVKSVSV
jgi:F-type H+-transporting ATPase subunit beta